MTEEYVGSQVSVEVAGGLGFYQGRLVAINTQRQTLSLSQVIHNGRPAQLSDVTIKEGDGEWQCMPTGQPMADYSSPRRGGDPHRGTPNKKERQRRARNDATFADPVDDMSTEFDFESNLALFDKRAVYEEIQSHKPDVVRQTVRENYRYDENVLPSKPMPERKIIVPTSGAAEVIYANDNGLLVPSVTSELRAALLSTANQHGLTNSRQLEMIGRAATEVIMSISGCSHRLDPSNTQLSPLVVLLCGSHLQGAAGLECQGVQTLVVTPPSASSTPTPLLLTHELQLYAMTGGRLVADTRTLPSTLDLIVDARLDHAGRAGEGGTGLAWLSSTAAWASTSRAPVLALDPPSDLAALPSTPTPLPARVLLCAALPLAYTPARGKVYLLSLPLPLHTFAAVGIKYVSPLVPRWSFHFTRASRPPHTLGDYTTPHPYAG
ncbi:Enhancer of mRNA-decapping protein 3 [Chionoecetes opilio]|uniref:Enhancer of mRNA-decapping protein 3 n=1 Tax=Chionoecetes opilio TaxID=41210 RepID=A0A8J4XL80_CHIOP|nr:Enhancer of mRNA-decapping protein 3 [Chionoecetes opilio]